MRSILWLVVTVGACSKPTSLLGRLPDDAGELLGALCAGTNGGGVEPDDQLARARTALDFLKYPPGVEGIRCGTQDPDHSIPGNAMAFDQKTRRLFALRVEVNLRDLATLNKLVAPTLLGVERAGWEIEMARVRSVELIDKDHSWDDGRVFIATIRHMIVAGVPRETPSEKFTVFVYVVK